MNRDSTIKTNQGVILYDQKRFDEAIVYFKDTCQTDISSLYMLGLCYFNGEGIESNSKEAAKYFMKAAEKNHWQSIIKLATIYWYDQEYEKQGLFSNTMERNVMESVLWSLENKTLYDLTDGYAFYNNGQFEEAIICFRNAYLQGDLDAAFELGKCYLLGQNVKNPEKAKNYFSYAANHEDIRSQFMMGEFHLRGHGVTKDYFQAADWFYKAAQGGHQIAKIELEKLLAYEDIKQYIENLQQQNQSVSNQTSDNSHTESKGKNNLILGILMLLCSLLLGALTTEIPAFSGFCGFIMLVGAITTLVGLIQYCNS